MAQEVTLREIAKLLHLSVSTVSKSLSHSPEISKATRGRVQKLAEAMHYKPNYFATKLRGGSTKTIGVILPTVLNPYYAKLLTGIELVLAGRNYKMMALFSNDSRDREVECINALTDGSTDGMIICVARETQLNKHFNHLMQRNVGIPRIYVDRFDNTLTEDQVVSDDYDITQRVCRELIRNSGCKQIVFVSLMGGLTIEELRFQGYKTAMLGEKMDLNIKTIRTSEPGILQQQLLILIRKEKVDAIICANGSTTKKVLDIICNEDSIRNPNIHVVGFCAEHIKTLSKYPYLSIIDQCAEDLGGKAAKALLLKISTNNPTKPQIHQIKSRILL